MIEGEKGGEVVVDVEALSSMSMWCDDFHRRCCFERWSRAAADGGVTGIDRVVIYSCAWVRKPLSRLRGGAAGPRTYCKYYP